MPHHHDALQVSCATPEFTSLRVIRDNTMVLASAEVARGCERWLALLLAELVARGALDVAEVRHWFEISAKNDPFKI